MVKILNFSCVEKLQSVLNKSCSQTIRPTWEEASLMQNIRGFQRDFYEKFVKHPTDIKMSPKTYNTIRNEIEESLKILPNERITLYGMRVIVKPNIIGFILYVILYYRL